MAPFITGGIEAAGEYLGTKYLSKLFGLDEAVTQGGKMFTKECVGNFLMTLGVENLTEFGQ